MCPDIWYSSISPLLAIFNQNLCQSISLWTPRTILCHVTTISKSRLRAQKSIKWDYSTYFRAFIKLYFDYRSPYLCNHLWIYIYNRLDCALEWSLGCSGLRTIYPHFSVGKMIFVSIVGQGLTVPSSSER